MPRVQHFDIPTEDPETLRGFYEEVFGWKFEKWGDPTGQMEYWMISTGEDEPGIDGGMSKKQGPEDRAVNTIGVPDVDKYIERIEKNGGTVTMPKTAIPGVGWIAGFLDPQGNGHMIMQDDQNAR